MNPWNEGYGARYDCKPRDGNPYAWPLLNSRKAFQEWDEGWFFADSEIRTM